MNDLVKAILLTAVKLSPEERQELAHALLETLEADPAEVEQQLAGQATDLGSADEPAQQRPSDVLARYLDS
jgi:hypothetical protein